MIQQPTTNQKEIEMEQIEKLFAACSPATIQVVLEQVHNYQQDIWVNNRIVDPMELDQEFAWCDRVRETGQQMIKDKSE